MPSFGYLRQLGGIARAPQIRSFFPPNATLDFTPNMAENNKMRHDGRVQRPNELAAMVVSIQNQYGDGEIPPELQYAIRAAGNLLKDAMTDTAQGMAVFKCR